jgi:hypothetical protein
MTGAGGVRPEGISDDDGSGPFHDVGASLKAGGWVTRSDGARRLPCGRCNGLVPVAAAYQPKAVRDRLRDEPDPMWGGICTGSTAE